MNCEKTLQMKKRKIASFENNSSEFSEKFIYFDEVKNTFL